VNTNDDYISIPEAAEIFRHNLKHKSTNKYDKIYRSILSQAKSGKFSVVMLNNRTVLINKQEFCDYLKNLSNTQYEQIQFDLDNINDNNSVNNKCENTSNLKELLTLIKLHRKLSIPPEETLRYIERLLSDLK
jgi:hypothetical protein